MLDFFKRDVDLNERKRLHCGACKRVTIHNLEARCSGGWSDPENGESGSEHYSIFRCGACDAVCYETVSCNTYEEKYNDDGEPYTPEHAVQYPAPVSAHFNFNTEYTPNKLDIILDEMLYALAGSKMILATIGLRLAVEFMVNDKKCSGRSLQEKINDLRNQNLIDNDQKELLHLIRQRGNAGAHESSSMSAKELIAGMSIIELLLEKLYNGPARYTEIIEKAKNFLNVDIDKSQ